MSLGVWRSPGISLLRSGRLGKPSGLGWRRRCQIGSRWWSVLASGRGLFCLVQDRVRAQAGLVGLLAAAGAKQPPAVDQIADQEQVQDKQDDLGDGDFFG